jgi:hypothetical protein
LGRRSNWRWRKEAAATPGRRSRRAQTRNHWARRPSTSASRRGSNGCTIAA